MKKIWTTTELKYLRENAGIKTAKEIAAHLNRTDVSVYQMALKSNIKIRKTFKWTTEKLIKIETLINKRVPLEVICEQMCIEESALLAKCRVMSISLGGLQCHSTH